MIEKSQIAFEYSSTETIRSNESIKEVIRDEMEGIEEVMAEVLKRPRRKIVID